MSQDQEVPKLHHAFDRIDTWVEGWRRHRRIIMLLDFDGTLAPIVDRPDAAEMPDATRRAIRALVACPGSYVAVVSGRGLADARDRAAIDGIAYAGNHGMEIVGPGLERIHPEAAAARPTVERARNELSAALSSVPGAIVEDKGLTLSIHYRLVVRTLVDRVRRIVDEEVAPLPDLRVTEGKEVLEVRPAVDWDKGRAVEFLLENLRPEVGTPVVYIGDDRTDEDAFRVLLGIEGGEGVIVTDAAEPATAATSVLRTTEEVAQLLDLLVRRAPG